MLNILEARGIRALALFAAVVGLLFAVPALASAAPRIETIWWLPENISAAAHPADRLFYIVLFITGLTFVFVAVTGMFFVIRYRAQPGRRAIYSHGNDRLEILWTVIPLIVFVIIGLYSQHIWNEAHAAPEGADFVEVDVVAYQFGWLFRYPGVDKAFGADKIELLQTNSFGLVEGDLAAADDITTINEMVVPVDTVVKLHLRTKDVIHSFYVPHFRLYQDIVPGKKISWVWFKPTKTGKYQVACSQLCGTGHYRMYSDLRILSKEDYTKWLAEKEQERLGTQAAPAPTAAAAPAPQPSTRLAVAHP